MIINQYDGVRLKDGRTGCIVEIWKQGVAYSLDIGDGLGTWDNIDIKHDDIAEVIWHSKP
jgi:hypothetical protein